MSSFISTGSRLSGAAFSAFAAVLVYALVGAAREGEVRRTCVAEYALQPAYAGSNLKAPDFNLAGLDGRTVSLHEFAGKVVILNFWTLTCGPCLEEMPELEELSSILKGRSDVVMLAVSTDENAKEANDALASVLRKAPSFRVLMDPDAKVVRGLYGTHLFPETWLIDKKGIIAARVDGAREWSNASVVELIDQLGRGESCPVGIKLGVTEGPAAPLFRELAGGGSPG